MNHVTLTLVFTAAILMTGCARMTCPIEKNAQNVAAIDYTYNVDSYVVRNKSIANTEDLERLLPGRAFSNGNSEVISLSVCPLDADASRLLVAITYKTPKQKE